MKRLLIISLIYYLCASCSQSMEDDSNGKPIRMSIFSVDVQMDKPEKISAISESVEIIQLQTLEDNILGRVTKIAVTDNFIFVASFKEGLFQFDKKGQFIRQIGSVGKGPGEYKSVPSMLVDSDKELIYVASSPKIISYDFEGNLINEFLTIRYPEMLSLMDGKLRVATSKLGILQEDGNYLNQNLSYSLNEQGNIIDSMVLRSVKTETTSGALPPSGLSFIHKVNSDYLVYYPVLIEELLIRDTLYRIEEEQLVPHLKLNFGDIDKENTPFAITDIYKSSRFVFSTYFYDRVSRLFCYDEKEKKSYNLSDGFEDDIYQTGRTKLLPLDLANDELFYLKYGYELESIMEGVTEASNPVLFLVKLKD